MASNNGRFISKHLMNKKLELFVNLDSEWLSYADGDAQSYTILIGTPINYDEESGVITLKNDIGQIFYMCEEFIELFYVANSGFKLLDNTTSTIRTGKKRHRKTNRDIM